MNESPNNVTRDLELLGYLDALEAGNLETVATYWDKASHDPELEFLLLELEDSLRKESRWPRAPEVNKRPRWARRAMLVGSLVAAGLLAVAAWQRWIAATPVLPTKAQGVLSAGDPPPVQDGDLVAAWQRATSAPGKPGLGSFDWPLEENSPTRVGSSIPADLFD